MKNRLKNTRESSDDDDEESEAGESSGNDVEDDQEGFVSEDEFDLKLQEAYAKGELKPGLFVVGGKEEKKKVEVINNVEKINELIDDIKLNPSFKWIERLDIVNGLAPLAPEIALQLDDHRDKRERDINFMNSRKRKNGTAPPAAKSIEKDVVHNDFVRELNFYRQAQAAVLEALPRLRAIGVPTKRPEDYFAEMAKTDGHMQKVAQVLQKRQTATEKAEKVRKVRQQKKFAKQTQVQVIQQRHKEKKEMMENLKKYKKGQKNSLDFLDDKVKKGGSKRNSKGGGPTNDTRGTGLQKSRKRQVKDEQYGYGGNRKGSKWNTKESLDGIDKSKNKSRIGSRGRGGGGRGGNSSFGRGASSTRDGRGGGGRSDSFGRGASSSRDSRGGGGRGGNFGRGASSSRDSRGGGGRGGNFGRGASTRGGRDENRSFGRGGMSSRGRGGGRGMNRGGDRGRGGPSSGGRESFSGRGSRGAGGGMKNSKRPGKESRKRIQANKSKG